MRKTNVNSLDRRLHSRNKKTAEIFTFWDELSLRACHVIECSTRGARVVLPQSALKSSKIGVVVQWAEKRVRTFARVAWSSPLKGSRMIVGLEFLDLAS